MKTMQVALSCLGLAIVVAGVWNPPETVNTTEVSIERIPVLDPPEPAPFETIAMPVPSDPEAVPAFVERGLKWLVQAQYQNGGWGAGSHARQDIRDPRAVQADPATTAFSAMALLRAGNTLTEGPYHEQVRRALFFMIRLVEDYPEEGPNITDIAGTQPQVKLGQNIDVSMAAQFFTRILPHLQNDAALQNRVRAALQTCLNKLARAQSADGSWNDRGGWASVLQSAMANNAFELADEAGIEVDQTILEKSRAYQRSNVDAESGEVRTESAAGVSLYSIASNQRATAREARAAQDVIERGRRDGNLDEDAMPTADNLRKMGVSEPEARKLEESYRKNVVTRQMLKNDAVLQGFGNNGGEEFLSFMMTSESLVVAGGEDWEAWYGKMYNLLSSIQNDDGSWSGHHCITSPVFCTAAVVLAMLAERDRSMLMSEQQTRSSNG